MSATTSAMEARVATASPSVAARNSSRANQAKPFVIFRAPRTVAKRSSAAASASGKRVNAAVADSEEKPFAAWDLPATIPSRTDIKTIMIIGAGPIIIGQVRIEILMAGPSVLRLFFSVVAASKRWLFTV
jgi:hypothetical protein